MTKSLRTVRLPPIASGPVTGEALRAVLTQLMAELAGLDVRSDVNDFAEGMYQDDAGKLVVGADARLSGRPSSSLPTVLEKVGDNGRASTQTFLPQVQTGGVSSRQDAGPVTAEATVGNATITIAAHTLQYGDRLVTYNAGEITGLDDGENYYVYADDPEYAGGAVSYSATTNGQTVTANNGRYFVGAVRTTVALTVADIDDASETNPIEFTTDVDHGWNTGNTVYFDGLPGDFAVLNGAGTYAITRTGADTFTIAYDGSGFAAYTSGGTATRESATAISGAGGASGWIDMAFLGQF